MTNMRSRSRRTGGILGEQWQVDNFYRRQGSNQLGTWSAKDGPDYVTSYELDQDGDGEFESTVRANVYELRYTHLQHDGVIFLRTFPISTNQQDKRLDVLLHRYVEGIAGAGYAVTALDEKRVDVVEKRFAATITREGPASIGGREAYAATIEVKNVDQLQADPTAKGTLVELVVAHTAFRYVARPAGTTQMGAAIPPKDFPVLLIAGYSNRYSDFAESWPEFRAFLSQVQIDGLTGAAITYPEPKPSSPPSVALTSAGTGGAPASGGPAVEEASTSEKGIPPSTAPSPAAPSPESPTLAGP